MNRIFAACAALIMTVSAATARPSHVPSAHFVSGKLNVFGSPFTAGDREALEKRIASVARQMHATITVIVTTDPTANMRSYAFDVYDAIVSDPSRDIIIVIRASRNPDGRVIAGTGFIGFDSLQVETGYLYPSLRSHNYRRSIDAALNGILAQKA